MIHKLSWLLLLCFLGITATQAKDNYLGLCQLDQLDNEKVLAYIEKYKHIAIYEMDRSGIPASIKMGQAILESKYGESTLAQKANNHFGMKCGSRWKGKTYYMWDDEEVKSCFRVYPTAEESFIAHTEFLMDPKKEYRYGVLFTYNRTAYREWAKGVQKAGHATATNLSLIHI